MRLLWFFTGFQTTTRPCTKHMTPRGQPQDGPAQRDVHKMHPYSAVHVVGQMGTVLRSAELRTSHSV